MGAGLTGGGAAAATVNAPRAAALGRTRLQASLLVSIAPGRARQWEGQGAGHVPPPTRVRWGVMASGGDGGSGRGAAEGMEPSRGEGVERAGTGGGSSESGSSATSPSASSE